VTLLKLGFHSFLILAVLDRSLEAGSELMHHMNKFPHKNTSLTMNDVDYLTSESMLKFPYFFLHKETFPCRLPLQPKENRIHLR